MAQIPGTEDLYPFSSAANRSIPLEIVKIAGLIEIDFGSEAIDEVEIPGVAEFLILYATEGCYVQLGGPAILPIPETFYANLHYIPADCVKVIDFGDAEEFGVISADGVDGVLRVEIGLKWEDIRKVGQVTNVG